jgi:hypothetical protein
MLKTATGGPLDCHVARQQTDDAPHNDRLGANLLICHCEEVVLNRRGNLKAGAEGIAGIEDDAHIASED